MTDDDPGDRPAPGPRYEPGRWPVKTFDPQVTEQPSHREDGPRSQEYAGDYAQTVAAIKRRKEEQCRKSA